MYLPEIGVALNRSHYACWGGASLEEVLPKTCPCCEAKRVRGKPRYRCGAEYLPLEPQGQTHTDVFWGECPARIDPLLADNLGLVRDIPPVIAADYCEEVAGLPGEAQEIREMIARAKKRRNARKR